MAYLKGNVCCQDFFGMVPPHPKIVIEMCPWQLFATSTDVNRIGSKWYRYSLPRVFPRYHLISVWPESSSLHVYYPTCKRTRIKSNANLRKTIAICTGWASSSSDHDLSTAVLAQLCFGFQSILEFKVTCPTRNNVMYLSNGMGLPWKRWQSPLMILRQFCTGPVLVTSKHASHGTHKDNLKDADLFR